MIQVIGEIDFKKTNKNPIYNKEEEIYKRSKFTMRFNGLKKAYLLLTSFLSYLFFAPTYIHIFIINAFARIDDLSWGTKGIISKIKIEFLIKIFST
jgi:hypothetical protein